MIFVLILALLAETQGGCPVKCNCTQNSVNCVSSDLERVPDFEDLDNNPIIIDLSGNSISQIDVDDFSFDKGDHVIEIYLNNSGVIMIDDLAFDELENLQDLYLSDNLLNSVPENFIVDNPRMVLLDLSSNYFTEMPKFRSDSLEVLAVVNSGISRIANDALEGLPNLRLLLLSQNNLKTINPVTFQHMGHLFFIRVAYNPWNCDCKTIKLFDYLTERGFVDLIEPVQCQKEDKIFVDIYDDRGVVPTFQHQCDGFDGNFEESEEIFELEIALKNLEQQEEIIVTTVSSNNHIPEKNPNFYFGDFCYLVILGSAVVLSLFIGAICGSCLTFKYLKRNIKQTDSTKELIAAKFDESSVTYTFS